MYDKWIEAIKSEMQVRSLYGYAHKWELDYWFKVKYRPEIIARVLSERGSDWVERVTPKVLLGVK